MIRSVFLGLVFLLFAVPLEAQQEANADHEAVRQAVLDYVEGQRPMAGPSSQKVNS